MVGYEAPSARSTVVDRKVLRTPMCIMLYDVYINKKLGADTLMVGLLDGWVG